jgi:hypothetical protein
MSKQYRLLRKTNNTYYKVLRTTAFYYVDCPQSYPTIAWGIIGSGLYTGRSSVFISNVNTNAFVEKVLEDTTHILDCKAIFCPNPMPYYEPNQREYVTLLYNFMDLYWFIQANLPEVLTGESSNAFQIYQTESILSKTDMTNYGLTYPYMFLCTSGENASFYQKDETDIWTGTEFIERSTNLPDSEITIIKADDAT